jgi:hypothetical protein
VFGLVAHLDHVEFLECTERVAGLDDFRITDPRWQPLEPDGGYDLFLPDRWRARRCPWPGSSAWRYLNGERRVPAHFMGTAIKGGLFRERPHGSIWAAHSDKTGVVSGWEARGPQYRGLSSGERKALFRLGPVTALRLAVTEAAIDAMSLAAGSSDGTLYLSAGGGWSPAMQAALRELAPQPDE